MGKRVLRLEPLPKLAPEYRVAAYARVSSGKDAMKHSLSAQVSYFSSMIQNHPGWVYAGVYADEAVTGTKDDRPEFSRLLADCRAGKVDMIVTKTVSRFARNTVTLLQMIRELKALGIDVYFEEQNLHSKGAEGELLLTILAVYAQEESRSASENVKWHIRNEYAKGKSVCWRFMYGYRISRGKVAVDPGEAAIVREVFSRFAGGESLVSLERWLAQNGHHGYRGGKWRVPRLREMLSNEKYIGNDLLQKTYVNNHLEKKKVVNRGVLPKYHVTETHPAIIDRETFEAVQKRLAGFAEEGMGRQPWQECDLTGMIRCAHCGRRYRRVSKSNRNKWACPTYYREGKKYCPSRMIPEDALKETVRKALGLDGWQPEVFHRLVDHIMATGPNGIELHMRDGAIIPLKWKDRSRSESWTPEMRERARERVMGHCNGQ